MTIQAEAAKLKGKGIFIVRAELEKLFFDFPLSIDLLKSMGIAMLLKFADQIKAEILDQFNETSLSFDLDNMNQLKGALKKNPRTNAILKVADQLMDEESLSNVLMECEKAIANNDPTALFSATNTQYLTESQTDISKFIASIQVENNNSLLDKLDLIKAKLKAYKDKYDALMDIMTDYLAYMMMGYYIIKLIISLFDRSDIPSGYLSRYVGKLINTLIASLTEASQELYDMLASILSIIKSADALLTGLIVSMTLYTLNRLNFQDSSRKELAKVMCINYNESLEPFLENPTIIASDSSIDLNNITDLPNACVMEELPEYLVPKEPFELKLLNSELNCEIDFIEEEDITELEESKPVLVTNAVIENQREDKLRPFVEKGNKVKVGKLLCIVGDKKIYSPINGIVYDVTPTQIFFNKISDDSQSFLEKKSLALSEKYNELNECKAFLNKWPIRSLYPVMLANSPSNDGEITIAEGNSIKNVGVSTQWSSILDSYNADVGNYEKEIQIIASEENVRIHAENETLITIKEDIDNEHELLAKQIKKYQKESVSIARVTRATLGEYSLVEYYFTLLLELAAVENKTSYEIEFYKTLHSYQEQRLYIEQYDTANLSLRAGELTKQLLGDLYQDDLDLIAKVEKSYNVTNEIKEIKDWLIKEAVPIKNISEADKTKLINQIIFLLEFVVKVPEYAKKYGELDQSKLYDQIKKEGNYINRFINNIFKKITNIPSQIKTIESQIDDIALITTFSLIEYNSSNHRRYIIPIDDIDDVCKNDSDPNVGGATETDFSDIKYWLKYFSIATLSGCGLPGVGWATGFIAPTGPVLFPVVYIPIKAISMEYGFIVFGLTITGIVPMPFMMFVNLSTSFQLPMFDPVKGLKNEISAMKLNLVGQLDEFKLKTIKQFLIAAKTELDAATVAYDGAKANHIQHKSKKPPKTKKYIKERAEWTASNLEYIQSKLTFGVAKFTAETKYSLLYILWSVGGGLSEKISSGLGQAFTTLKQAEDLINIQFDALAKMVETLEKIIGPLPITLKPDSANWGFTLKNPMPLTPFGLQLTAPMIQLNILDPIIEEFRAKNAGLLLPGGISLDYASYIELIQTMLSIIILRDPFPPYEKLSIINIAWVIFLTGELIPFGARQFGMPGMP